MFIGQIKFCLAENHEGCIKSKEQQYATSFANQSRRGYKVTKREVLPPLGMAIGPRPDGHPQWVG